MTVKSTAEKIANGFFEFFEMEMEGQGHPFKTLRHSKSNAATTDSFLGRLGFTL